MTPSLTAAPWRTYGVKGHMSDNPGSQSATRFQVGVIHGRFQVVHMDHMRYLLAGKNCCDHLVVGVTNPDPLRTQFDQADPERGTLAANPLTYYERQQLLRCALEESGVPLSDFTLVPFPINTPELLCHYAPRDAAYFLTIYDAWGQAKLQTFRALGLNVHVLWERPPEKKGLSGKQVRQAILHGRPWEHMVPRSNAALLRKWDIAARLRRLENSE